MKRPSTPPSVAGISRTWPRLFWTRCRKCGCEFRRELGWKRVVADIMGPGGMGSRFLGAACGDCAPTRAEAEVILGDKPDGPPKVQAPKPPPGIQPARPWPDPPERTP